MADGTRKPHLIVLMADQLRCDVLGAYGDEQCPTPRLDLLADRSTTFLRHFTPCPLCVPARSSIMTGLSPRRHGAIINGWVESEREFGTIRKGVPLLPQRLVDRHYRVVHVGVQHVRSRPDFQTQLPQVEFHGPMSSSQHLRDLDQRGLMYGDLASLRDPIIDFDSGKPLVYDANSPRPAVFPLREDLFYDCVLAERMVETIKGHCGRTDDAPLALFGMFWLPHPPLWAPEKYAGLIDPYELRLPPTVGHWFRGMPVAQLANVPGQLGAHVSMDQWHEAWSMYLGMAALLDVCVGRVLATLDKRGLLDDALVVFTSDHGEMLGSHRLFQKMCLYEDAARVPLMMKMPGQSTPRRVWDLTDHLDLTATLLDLAGAEPMPDATGTSLRQLADTGAVEGEPRDEVFSGYDGNAGRGFAQRMIRTRSHKLIHHPGPENEAELYDLIDDPYETLNRIGKPEVAGVERRLRDRLNRWMDEQQDPAVRC